MTTNLRFFPKHLHPKICQRCPSLTPPRPPLVNYFSHGCRSILTHAKTSESYMSSYSGLQEPTLQLLSTKQGLRSTSAVNCQLKEGSSTHFFLMFQGTQSYPKTLRGPHKKLRGPPEIRCRTPRNMLRVPIKTRCG